MFIVIPKYWKLFLSSIPPILSGLSLMLYIMILLLLVLISNKYSPATLPNCSILSLASSTDFAKHKPSPQKIVC